MSLDPELQPAADESPVAPPAPARLLLVDDEPGLRTAVQAYLEDEGFQVTTAVDGEDGWTKAQELLPDLVISDVMMPRLDGYGLLKRLRADERLGGTPVIFLTAKGMTADRIEGFQAGADDYIPKPFDPDELVARVQNVVRRQERLLAEAARYADADIGQMAKQITEIRTMLTGGGSKKAAGPVRHDFTPREASVLQLVAAEVAVVSSLRTPRPCLRPTPIPGQMRRPWILAIPVMRMPCTACRLTARDCRPAS